MAAISAFQIIFLSPIGFFDTIFLGCCCLKLFSVGTSAAGFVVVGVEVGKFVDGFLVV
jgi:hypothetical protein